MIITRIATCLKAAKKISGRCSKSPDLATKSPNRQHWLPKGHDHGCPSNVGPNRTRTDQRPTTNDQRQVGQRYRTLSMSGHQARVRSWSKSSSGTTHVPTDTAKREETRENQASLYYLPSREPQSSLFTRFLWLTKNLFSFVQVFFRLQFQISNKNCYVFDIL